MAERNTKETIKRYSVLCLAVVFIAVGYFRFFHEQEKSMPAATAAQSEIPLVVPEVKTPSPSRDGRTRVPVTDRWPAAVRDIFSPGEFAPANETTIEQKQTPAPTSFTLKGTIVAGNRPIAIINNRFVRTGDWIEGYRVVKIDTKKVWLESGNHRIAVDVMPYE
jgi:hypothetical protein